MDIDEATRLLTSGSEGVQEWNSRRAAGEEIPSALALRRPPNPDTGRGLELSGVDLGGIDLGGSDLQDADLEGAHLYRANLSRVRLGGANLRRAHLVEADLTAASLYRCHLEGADLRRASMRDAESDYASFESARLDGAHLASARMSKVDFRGASLVDAKLSDLTYYGAQFRTSFERCSFMHADLRGVEAEEVHMGHSSLGEPQVECCFDGADLAGANFSRADLRSCSFHGAHLEKTDFRGADLRWSRLDQARMIGTRLEGASIDECSVYGASTWDVGLDDETIQRDLNISPSGEASVTVDNLEVAQFVYLLMSNARIRDVIDTITSKVVLILGRFTDERKAVLDALRSALRGDEYGYVPIVFDFAKPASRSTAETVGLIASMARFVIADLTDAKSVLQELREIVPARPSLPIQPLLLESQDEPAMLDSFRPYPWFLRTVRYSSTEELLGRLEDVVEPATSLLAERSEDRRNEP